MPRGPDGSYTLPVGTIVASGDTLLPSQHNPAMTDIAASLTNSLARNGLGNMQADLNMGGFDITNVGAIAGYAQLTGAAFTGAISVAGNVSVTGNVSVAGNITVTTGNNTVGLLPTGTFGGANFRNADNARSGYVEFTKGTTTPGGQDAYIGYMPNAAGAQPLNYNNSTGGVHAFNTQITMGGFRMAHGTRSNIYISDGTAAPSGGVDGDIYFQYT